jgi:adenosine kinase
MLHGLTEGYDWETTGRLASLMGSSRSLAGPQNHAVQAEIEERFHKAFGYRFG